MSVAACSLLAAASARSGAGANVGWLGFGNQPNQLRQSPLTDITPGNVKNLGRLFTVDFRQLDSSIRRGQQSYPVESNGTLYVSTNDNNVFALNATTGAVRWRWQPDNVAVFRNFGIVANRGVALCDGHVFLLTLDMTIVSLDAATGHLERRVPIAKAVPGASSSYGYSETSAPMCANHRLVIGAAGSEYGVRGFVMAYHTDLTPAWPNPFWTIPPNGTGWRKYGTLVGGGVVWTPTSIDAKTNTLYFGTGSATPLYFPSIRPGSNPRADSLIAVDLASGRMRWWQQQKAHNEWSSDTAQPPMIYDANVGGKTMRVVSVGTMEGVWFAYDAKTGRPLYQRVKVVDRTEHPTLQPGREVTVFPASIGGINYSPASYDPKTNYVFNGAAETAAVEVQTKLTPTQKKRKFLLGDVFLGLQNGNFGASLPGWHDHGSISAIDVRTGKRVWKFTTPEPERGGVTTTASGLGFAGGGDGVFRAFDLKTGKVLWTFQTGHQIASGASIYSVDGTEYIAITSGGTPTSSGGGTASELQVFTLGASQKESPPPVLPFKRTSFTEPVVTATAPREPATARRPAAGGGGRVASQAAITVRPWDANSSNVQTMTGRLLLRGTPVAHATIKVDGYVLRRATTVNGGFRYDADATLARKHQIRVAGLGAATVHGRKLTDAERSALLAASGTFSVGYAVDDLHATRRSNGTVAITGRVHDTAGNAPPPVALQTYQLTGTITDASGKPVQNAVVITRTQDRDFWTFSSATDADGHYSSFFAASDETDANPVPLAVGVAYGGVSYGGNVGTNAPFDRLRSAQLNIQLGSGARYTVGKPTSYAGAVYQGLVVGVSGPGGIIKPVSSTWPDAKGRFTIVLPSSARGKTVRFWENQRQFFTRGRAAPGGPVDLSTWPTQLGNASPAGLASLKL
ncbi:MAG TPA: PQQ-binding-like beta-propeller repeat protein [Gaiellaceae bacterium]|nr:PQQ-binding-like beta-propeller repeat protein [Gaiellaceae bacterium]